MRGGAAVSTAVVAVAAVVLHVALAVGAACPALAKFPEGGLGSLPEELRTQVEVATREVEMAIHRLQRQLGTVGVAALAISGEDIFWSSGFGFADKSLGKPVDPLDTVFRIGSVSKVFTALGLYKARDQGLLSLDNEVRKYAPQFRIKNPFSYSAGREITFQQLASHMAGVPREEPCTVPCLMNNSEAFKRISELSMIESVDVTPVYSNLGFSILGNVLASVHQQEFSDYMMSKVIFPLGLFSTGVDIDKAPLSRLAVPYLSDGTVCSNAVCLGDLGWANPSGSFYSSGRDLAHLMIALMGERPTGGRDSFLAAATIRESFLPRYIYPDRQTGFATPWELYYNNNYLLRTKGGDVDGYSSALYMVPELRLGFAVLANVMGHADPYAQRIASVLVPTFDSVFKVVQKLPAAPPDWDRYVGNYSCSDCGGSLVVTGGSVSHTSKYLNIFSPNGFVEASSLEWRGRGHTFRLVSPAGSLEPCIDRQWDSLYEYVVFEEKNGEITSLRMPGISYSAVFPRDRDS